MSNSVNPKKGKMGKAIAISAYSLLMIAGATLPFQLMVMQEPFEILWWMMTAWLFIGGTLGNVDQFKGTWVGQFIGLPLIFTALFGFGFLQLQVSGGFTILAVPSVALLWAFGFLGVHLWRDTWKFYKVVRESNHQTGEPSHA